MSEHLPDASRRLRRMASDYEESMPESRAQQLAARAFARAQARDMRPQRRMAILAGAASLLFALVGIGYGAAKSLPGDSLYGVSRTYERLGQLAGIVDPVEQRLHEVIALAERGDRELAAQVAGEALEELGRRRGVSVSPPGQVSTPPSIDEPTTASPETAPDDDDSGSTSPAGTTPVDSGATVDATDDDTEEDPIRTLKLAAELLLDRVRENGDELDVAAANLAVAVSALATEDEPTTVAADDSTATASSSSSTTTTPEAEPGSSTSTTTPDSGSSTTSSTIPGDDPPEDGGEGEGDGPGPIFLPPEF